MWRTQVTLVAAGKKGPKKVKKNAERVVKPFVRVKAAPPTAKDRLPPKLLLHWRAGRGEVVDQCCRNAGVKVSSSSPDFCLTHNRPRPLQTHRAVARRRPPVSVEPPVSDGAAGPVLPRARFCLLVRLPRDARLRQFLRPSLFSQPPRPLQAGRAAARPVYRCPPRPKRRRS